ncbi:MAG: hypothetical protein HYY06_12845 [Deltaproteobacteria bacterium]|nr:hypothetical protein [Deltaproteobacteria bacterium]
MKHRRCLHLEQEHRAWYRGEGFDDLALEHWMGGEATLESCGVAGRPSRLVESERQRVPKEHRAFFDALALAIDLEVAGERYRLIHAGLPGHVSFEVAGG